MKYRGYEVREEGDSIIIENVRDFDPVQVFECGQCFRWTKESDGSFTGVAMGRVINVSCKDLRLTIRNSSMQDFIDIWFEYFDLGRDYSAIKSILARDDVIREAIKFSHGIRILKQDPWETLISFIISANNRIPRIKEIVAVISRMYGHEIKFRGQSFFAFPGVERLLEPSIEELKECKAGFRCRYIVEAAQMLKAGLVDLNKLGEMSTDEARRELCKLSGVGNKVADCVLLYSGIKTGVFPTDVWIKRIMEELYFKRETSPEEISEFAVRYFGELAGFAQLYLYFYAREKRIGAK